MNLNADLLPVGTRQRITRPTRDGIFGMSWTEDGRGLVYSTERRPYLHELWRVSLDGTRAPEAIDVAGAGATDPAIGRAKHRLAFARGHLDTDIYRFEAGRAPEPVLTSSLADFDQEYSPDGTQIVFVSVRSGEAAEIWVAKADGSDAHQLTQMSLRWLRSPHWSPDGRRIAFEALDEANLFRVWTIGSEGGTVRPLTSGPATSPRPRGRPMATTCATRRAKAILETSGAYHQRAARQSRSRRLTAAAGPRSRESRVATS